MARIRDPSVKLTQYGDGDDSQVHVGFSYRMYFQVSEVEENIFYRVHTSLWEKDGKYRDLIDTSYNGPRYRLWRESGGDDDFITGIDSRWVRPNGQREQLVSDGVMFRRSDLGFDPIGTESYYIHVGAHPEPGGNVEEYSPEAAIEDWTIE